MLEHAPGSAEGGNVTARVIVRRDQFGDAEAAIHDLDAAAIPADARSTEGTRRSIPAFRPDPHCGGRAMPRGDKSKYTEKQIHKAQHIAESYESRGTPVDEAEARAWATVNKESGGGNKSGSGRGTPENHDSSHRGGELGGAAAAARPRAARSASARKAAETRRRNAAQSS